MHFSFSLHHFFARIVRQPGPMPLNLKHLFGKLNHTTHAAMEGAAALGVSRGHHHIEIEHYLGKLIQIRNTDFSRICATFQIDTARLDQELQRSLNHFEIDKTTSPALSHTLVKLLGEAWCIGSINFGAPQIRSGFTLLALIEPSNHHELPAELLKLNPAAVEEQFPEIVRKSVEKEKEVAAETPPPGAGQLPG
jgi:type VI secretion system protein VasG